MDRKQMKSKNIILIIITIATLLAVLIFAVKTDYVKREKIYSKYFSLTSLDQIAKSEITPLKIYKIKNKNNEAFTMIDYPMYTSWISFPSGPPVAVFDKNGELIDKSFDCGDNPRFTDKWFGKNWESEKIEINKIGL